MEYKDVSGRTYEVEKFYTVGEPEPCVVPGCVCQNSVPVFTADMKAAGDTDP